MLTKIVPLILIAASVVATPALAGDRDHTGGNGVPAAQINAAPVSVPGFSRLKGDHAAPARYAAVSAEATAASGSTGKVDEYKFHDAAR